MKKYRIELTEKQVKLLSYVCDRFSRVIIGQLKAGIENELEEALLRHRFNGEMTDDYWREREKIGETLDFLHTFCYNQATNQSYGIRYSEDSDILIDIHQVLRHQLWLDDEDENKSTATVSSSSAHQWAKEPLIKIEKCKQKNTA